MELRTAAYWWCYGFPEVMLYCMPKVFINIKNRTDLFSVQNPENKSVLFFIYPRLCGM